MHGTQKHLMTRRWRDIVFLHQRHEVTGGEVVNCEPHYNDNESNDENINPEEFPEKSICNPLVHTSLSSAN